MLKVMDLFRHRSNSAVSEADKRKAVSCTICYLIFLTAIEKIKFVSRINSLMSLNFDDQRGSSLKLKNIFDLPSYFLIQGYT